MYEVDVRPAVMGTINLSRDSTYRESIATSTGSALRKGRITVAQGADLVDVGAETSTVRASRVGLLEQTELLVPVIEGLVDEGIVVSAGAHEPALVRARLVVGATIRNLSGTAHHGEMYALVSESEATVMMCYAGGANVREISDVTIADDPIPGLRYHFEKRLAKASAAAVANIAIDLGMGFFYGNLVDPMTRVLHRWSVLLNSFPCAYSGCQSAMRCCCLRHLRGSVPHRGRILHGAQHARGDQHPANP